MNILLLALNARYTHSNLGIRYLRQYALKKGYSCNLLELTINTNLLNILNEIYSKKPTHLGISVYIWNTKLVSELLPELKKILPNLTIILGGPEVSYNPQKWLNKFEHINHIITKNPEDGFVKALNNPNKKIIEGQKISFEDLPFAWVDEDFPENKNKYIYYESSRGCPFKCSYCLSSRLDISLEFKPWEKVKSELDFFIKHDVRIVKFVDRTFNAKKDHYKKVWKYLIEKSPKTKFHFEIHPALIDDDDFEILKKAPLDLFQFEIGIQSTNPQTLKAINRFSDYSIAFKNTIKLVELGNIHIHTDLIAGLPFEDYASFGSSFNTVYNLKATHLQLGFLKVLPGTQMQSQATEFDLKYLNCPPYQVIGTKWLSYTDFNKLQLIEHTLEVLHNSEIFSNTLHLLANQNPFKFYETMALNYFCDSQDFVKNAVKILEYAKTTDLYNQTLDALRFDWCLISKSRKYPDCLKTNFDDNMNDKYLNLSKEFKQNGTIPKQLTVKEFRHSILYVYKTDYGKNLSLNASSLLFYGEPKNKQQIKIFNN